MHAPAVIGYSVGLAQFCGGLAILTGILIRLGALCVIIVMLGAIFLVHLPHGFDIGHGGMEYALTQLLIACALMLTGAGRYSLSLPLPGRWRKCGPALLYLFPAAQTRTDSSAGYTEVPVRPPALA